jgi:type I restriction enzyme S subunit
VTVGSVGDYLNGYAFKPSDWETSGRPIIRIQNLNDDRKPFNYFGGEIDQKYLIKKGDILISWSASLGAFKWQGEDAWLNQHIFKASPNEQKVDRDFFYLAMKYAIERIALNARGSTMQHVTQSEFKNSEILLPPLAEQQKIAGVLSTVEHAAELQGKIIATSGQLKKTLMQRLFIEGLRGKEQKRSEIGLVPANWRLVPLQNLIGRNPQNGAFIKKPKVGSGGILFANVADMYRGVYLDLGKLERILIERQLVTQYMLDDGDILVVRSSLKREGVGQNCVVKNLAEPVFYDCHLIRIKPNSEKIIPEFLSYFWRSDSGRNDLIQRSKTTTMTTINQQGLLRAVVPVPELAEQREIVAILLTIDRKIQLHQTKLAVLSDLLRTLLYKLMTAEIRADDLDLAVPDNSEAA